MQFLNPRRAGVRSDLRRLAAARLVSMAGNDATGVAVGFALYAQTHSAGWLSLSLMLTIGTGALLSPLGGKAGDLFDRRRLMIAMELAAAVVLATLAFVNTPLALIGLGMLATAIGTVFGPAAGAAIAHVAGERHLSWANGAIATGSNVGKTLGRFGGGMLISLVGAAGVFALDALTFVVSALLIRSVRRGFSEPMTRAAPGNHPSGTESGIRTVLKTPTVRPVVLAACVGTFATSFSMTAEVPLVFELGAGAAGLGALTGCWALGMLAGSWYGGRALSRDNEPTGVLAGRVAMATGIGLVALAPSLAPMLACYVLGGFGGGFMGVAAQSLIMRSIPDAVRARAQGAIEGCRNVSFGLGVIGAGTAVTLAGARPVYGMVGLVMALGSLPLVTLVRRLGGPRSLLAARPVRTSAQRLDVRGPLRRPRPVTGQQHHAVVASWSRRRTRDGSGWTAIAATYTRRCEPEPVNGGGGDRRRHRPLLALSISHRRDAARGVVRGSDLHLKRDIALLLVRA